MPPGYGMVEQQPNPSIGQAPNPPGGGCTPAPIRYLGRVMTTPNNTKPARLYRSRDDRVIAGIAGGLAKHLGIDPVLARLVFVALALAAGSGVLAYLIAWFIIPEEPRAEGDWPETDRPKQVASSGTTRIFIGIALMVIGVGLLAEWAIPAIDGILWPLAVIGAGAGLLFYGAKR